MQLPRYGHQWTEDRRLGGSSDGSVREVEVGDQAITAITGYSDSNGYTGSLGATIGPAKQWGPWGVHKPYSGWSLRPSPAHPGLSLAFLSGCEKYGERRLIFHWRV